MYNYVCELYQYHCLKICIIYNNYVFKEEKMHCSISVSEN